MKKSLLFVNGHLQVGGVEKALVDLLSWLDYDKYDVDLLLLEGEGEYRGQIPDKVTILHKDIRLLEGPFWHNILSNLKCGRFGNVLYRIIRVLAKKHGNGFLRLLRPLLPVKGHYDVAIAFRHGHSAEIVAYPVKADRKYCWWHQGTVPDLEWQKQSLKRLFTEFDRLVTVSKGCKSLLLDYFGFDDSFISVVPNIVDASKLRLFAGEDNPYGDDKRFKIITLSRFAPEKHLEDVVEVAKTLSNKLDLVWYLPGDGVEYSKVKDRVSENGLEGMIILTGRISNPYPYLKYADLMVHPSYAESLCLSVLEAMALDIPCVVVRSIGPESFMVDGENGILTDKGPEAIVEGVDRLLVMETARIDELKNQARMMVENRFSPTSVVATFERLINGD